MAFEMPPSPSATTPHSGGPCGCRFSICPNAVSLSHCERHCSPRPAEWLWGESPTPTPAPLMTPPQLPSRPPSAHTSWSGRGSGRQGGARHGGHWGPPIASVRRLRLVRVGCGLGCCCISLLCSTSLEDRGCCVLVCRCPRRFRPVGPSVEAEGTEEEAEAHDCGESCHWCRFQVAVHRTHDDRAPDACADVRPASKSRRRNRLPEPRGGPSDADGGNARNERQEPKQGQHGPSDDIHSEPPCNKCATRWPPGVIFAWQACRR